MRPAKIALGIKAGAAGDGIAQLSCTRRRRRRWRYSHPSPPESARNREAGIAESHPHLVEERPHHVAGRLRIARLVSGAGVGHVRFYRQFPAPVEADAQGHIIRQRARAIEATPPNSI